LLGERVFANGLSRIFVPARAMTGVEFMLVAGASNVEGL
jgi:hypothetical protein